MPVADRIEVATYLLAEALSGPLKLAAERIDLSRPLSDLGVDSLLAIEIQLALASTFSVEFSTLELMRGATVSDLGRRVLERMGLATEADAISV